jgi:hypothetical protein
MDKEKLKLIVKNLESLVDCLKLEIYSDVDLYKHPQYEEIAPYVEDYDEVFYEEDDDDLYTHEKVHQRYNSLMTTMETDSETN